MHNGSIARFQEVKRELMLAVDPALYADVKGPRGGPSQREARLRGTTFRQFGRLLWRARSGPAPLLTPLRSTFAPLSTALRTRCTPFLTPFRFSVYVAPDAFVCRSAEWLSCWSAVAEPQHLMILVLSVLRPNSARPVPNEKALRREIISFSFCSVTSNPPYLIVAIAVAEATRSEC